MTRLIHGVVAACWLAVLVTAGCASSSSARSRMLLTYPHAAMTTLTQSPHEHYQMVSDVASHDKRALADDLDLLFMTDRPTRLTRWHSR